MSNQSSISDMPKSDFQNGWDAALRELQESEIELKSAFYSFRHDMPDSEFQWGFFAALYEKIEAEKIRSDIL